MICLHTKKIDESIMVKCKIRGQSAIRVERVRKRCIHDIDSVREILQYKGVTVEQSEEIAYERVFVKVLLYSGMNPNLDEMLQRLVNLCNNRRQAFIRCLKVSCCLLKVIKRHLIRFLPLFGVLTLDLGSSHGYRQINSNHFINYSIGKILL